MILLIYDLLSVIWKMLVNLKYRPKNAYVESHHMKCRSTTDLNCNNYKNQTSAFLTEETYKLHLDT